MLRRRFPLLGRSSTESSRFVPSRFVSKHSTSNSRLLALGVLLGLTGCAAAEPLAWCRAEAAGVEVVASAGEGAWAAAGQSARLVGIWRAGGMNEGEELAYPVGLWASPSGRIAVADFQLGEVVVLEPDGRWRGAWGRRGSGPGEVSVPVAAAWDRAGRLAVFDVVAPKVVFLEEGEPDAGEIGVAPSFTAPIVATGQIGWAGVQPTGGTLLQPPLEPTGDASDPGLRTELLLRLAPGGDAPDTLARALVRTVAEGSYAGWALPGWPRLVAAVGADGSVAVGGEGGEYRIMIHDADGAPVRQLCRKADPLPVTARERGVDAEAPRALADAVRNAPLPDSPAAFGRLLWGVHGRLWVQRDRPSPLDNADALYGPPGARWDLFDADGRYLGEVEAPPHARLQAAAGDTVWAFEIGEFDEAWVVAYRLVLE